MKNELKAVITGQDKIRLPDGERKRAAVLIPMFRRDGGYFIVFIRRTNTVSTHKGQISFPGGSFEEADIIYLSTALREASEEIGIKPEDVEIIGELDDEVTVTSNFIITPFVGFIPWPYRFSADSEEVAEILEVRLSALLDKNNLRVETRNMDGHAYTVPFYYYLDTVIWGATARILHKLLEHIVVANRLTPRTERPGTPE